MDQIMDAKDFLNAVRDLCLSIDKCEDCKFYVDGHGCILFNEPADYNVDMIMEAFDVAIKKHDKPVVKIKLFPGGRMPEKKTAGAAAYDCYARIVDGEECDKRFYFDSYNGETKKYPLGFALEMLPGIHAFVMARSGMGLKTQLICPIGMGLIDSDYRGEVAMLYEGLDPDADKGSRMEAENRIYDGDRIAQLLFNVPVELKQVDELTPTERGDGGFGGTGVNDEATK